MINLIPPIVRKAVITEYWIRVVSVWLYIVSVVSTALVFFALPVFIIVTSQVDTYAKTSAEAAQRVADYDLSAGSLVRANVAAQKIFELRETNRYSDVIKLIESLQGDNISLDSFTLNLSKDSAVAVQVTGQADTRKALSDFRDTLLSQENISEVILPISNLARDKDIKFSISITFKGKS
jgi:hypothetical protein